MFRIFAMAHPIMVTKVLELPALCAIAQWLISRRQAEDGHFVELGPVIMGSMQVTAALGLWVFPRG